MTVVDPRDRLEAALHALLMGSARLRGSVEDLHAEVEAVDITEAARERAQRVRANDEVADQEH